MQIYNQSSCMASTNLLWLASLRFTVINSSSIAHCVTILLNIDQVSIGTLLYINHSNSLFSLHNPCSSCALDVRMSRLSLQMLA